jgi:hypothetical protein
MGRGEMSYREREKSSAAINAQGQGSHPRILSVHAMTLIVAAGMLLLGAASARAKDKQPTTRTISGTVYDQAENIIPGATVELKDLQTGKVLDIYSQEDGQYLYTDLRFDHDYTVQAMFKGLASEVRHISILETRWTLVLNLTVPLPKK